MTSILHGLWRAVGRVIPAPQTGETQAEDPTRAKDATQDRLVVKTAPKRNHVPAQPKLAPALPSARRTQSTSSGSSASFPAPGTPTLSTNLRYGVEVEHQGLTSDQVSRAVCGVVEGKELDDEDERLIVAQDGREWRLDRDAGGVEVVTPVLRGTQDLAVVQQIVSTLNSAGGIADKRAGLHVHVDASGFAPENVQSLIALMARNEHWLYPVWGVHAQRRQRWCDTISAMLALKCMSIEDPSRAALMGAWGNERFRGLNLLNYLKSNSDKHTIEFRYLNGTLDPVALGCAVGFYVKVAEYALAGDGKDENVMRSSLPALLQDLGLKADDPIAAHLTGLLRSRIEAGWDTTKHGALPDLTALMQNEAFLTRLCTLLDAADTPADVAGAAHMVLHVAPDVLQERLSKAAQLISRVEEATGATMGAVAAMNLLAAQPGCQEVCVKALRWLRCMRWHAEDLQLATSIMLPYLGEKSGQLLEAVKVASILEPDFSDLRLRGLKTHLERSETASRELLASFDIVEQYFTPLLGSRLCWEHDMGADVRRLAQRLVALGALLRREPEICIEMAVDGPGLDLQSVANIMARSPFNDMHCAVGLKAAQRLVTWAEGSQEVLDKALSLLAWVEHDRSSDVDNMVRRLTYIQSETFAGLTDAMAKAPDRFAAALLQTALSGAFDEQDFARLCTAARILDCLGNPRDVAAFIENRTDTELRTLAAQLDAVGLPPMTSEQRFRALQALADYRGASRDLETHLCISAAATTPADARTLRTLHERYPQLDLHFFIDGLVRLQAGKITYVPGGLSTRDEGLLLNILSRSRPGTDAFGVSELADIGLPSMACDDAEQEVLRALSFGRSPKEVLKALRAHPNPHGFWGSSTMLHKAPGLASERRDGGALMLIAFYKELARQGVDIHVAGRANVKPGVLVRNAYLDRHRGRLLQLFEKEAPDTP